MAITDASDTAAPTEAAITVYWRQGCPYCSSLRSGLQRAGVPVREVNIWDDESARAFVRSVARGNETVPTVSIGTRHLVNPSVREILEVAETELPGLVLTPPDERSFLDRFRKG